MKKIYLMEYMEGENKGAHIFYDFGKGIQSLAFKNMDEVTRIYAKSINDTLNAEEREIPEERKRVGKSYLVVDEKELNEGNIVVKRNLLMGPYLLESGLLVGIEPQYITNYIESKINLTKVCKRLEIDFETTLPMFSSLNAQETRNSDHTISGSPRK